MRISTYCTFLFRWNHCYRSVAIQKLEQKCAHATQTVTSDCQRLSLMLPGNKCNCFSDFYSYKLSSWMFVLFKRSATNCDDFRYKRRLRWWNYALFSFFISQIASFTSTTRVYIRSQERDRRKDTEREKVDITNERWE